MTICDSWHYDARLTSTPLDDKRKNRSETFTYIGDTAILDVSDDIITNRITIDVEPEYQLQEDILKMEWLTFENNLGDALGLFLGMTIITFIQSFYWSVAALLLAYRTRRTNIVPQDSNA